MEKKIDFKDFAAVVSVVLAIIFFVASLFIDSRFSSLDKVASVAEKVLEKRLDMVEEYISQAMSSNHSDFFRVDDAPDDIVIYRYCDDNLQSWVNQFTISNDDIVNRQFFYSITATKYSAISPLSSLKDNYSYVNIGPKWYVARVEDDGHGCVVVGALEIKNDILIDAKMFSDGVNQNLKIPAACSIVSVNIDEGVPVSYKGRDLFKVCVEHEDGNSLLINSMLRWIALMFGIFACVLFLRKYKSLVFYAFIVILLFFSFAISYNWGFQLKLRMPLFSPSIYAGGEFFFSLGALLLLNLHIFLLITCTYVIRKKFAIQPFSNEKKWKLWVFVLSSFIVFALLVTYIHMTYRSLILNSNIVLEPLKVDGLSWYSVLVYISYSLLVLASILILHNVRPYIRDLFNLQVYPSERILRVLYAIIWTIYFCVSTDVIGLQKEAYMSRVWSNRLAVDRDLSLEMNLRSLESAISSDVMIAGLADLDGGDVLVLHRLADNYFGRILPNYDISLKLCDLEDKDTDARFGNALASGVHIASDSRFVYYTDANGRSSYLAMFVYYTKNHGLMKMYLELMSKSNRADRGYYSIFGKTSGMAQNAIPDGYSFGRYVDGRQVSYKGSFPFPTSLDEDQMLMFLNDGKPYYVQKGNVFFVNFISDYEVIVITRPSRTIVSVILSFCVIFLYMYFVLSLYVAEEEVKSNPVFRKNSYRKRINAMLTVLMVGSMVVLSLFSVTFVSRRNDTNLKNIMTSRLITIQSLIESQLTEVHNYKSLATTEFSSVLEEISEMTMTDISLYDLSGKVINSTISEAYDRMMIGTRIDEDALYNIIYKNQRYFIKKDTFMGKPYYSLFIPVLDHDGNMLAIAGVPYADKDNFAMDAFVHMATVIIIFFLLLILGLFASSAMINALFKPLLDMTQQLKSTSIDNLEKMHYSGNDELSSLVDAYNRMVEKLEESMKLVTQSERDKAWSEMARQVAHEIKNPLTPMQLTVQRLVRLKSRNVPDWDEKFKDASRIILEQIEILSDTANEFSTFAKLYTEEPVEIDLDRLIQDQVTMFSNRDDVRILYIGLNDARIMAPKPQLTRVFVNLITNAIQAVTAEGVKLHEIPNVISKRSILTDLEAISYTSVVGSAFESTASELSSGSSVGGTSVDGAIVDGPVGPEGFVLVSIRNSSKEGFYEIVVEDNGPGVSYENMPHLFTPNFTTKSSGTGLGLAICKNILEKCGGDISYRKSQFLKGASFTVRLPKI